MKNRILLYLSIISLILFSIFGCSPSHKTAYSSVNKNLNTKADVESVLSILYQQQAAEYRALCLQAYNIARQKVDEIASNKVYSGKKFAIITDLDETVLDNSTANAWLYLQDSIVNFRFLLHWWLKGIAEAVPGSVSFFNYANSKGIDIYYISNRLDSDIVVKATMKNMRNLGFPYTSDADANHFLFLKSGSSNSKESRRNQVEKIDSVILFLGDNLIDHDRSFDGQSNEIRRNETDRLKDKWGERYIVFPNSIYGDWESRLYTIPGLSKTLKDSARASVLKAFQ